MSSTSSSTSSVTSYSIGGSVTGLASGQSVKLVKVVTPATASLVNTNAAVSFPTAGLADPAAFTGAGTVGWSFSLDSSKTLSYLGLYNTDFNADTTVGIWNSSGSLLASSVFDANLTGVDLNDLLNSNFLWLPVSSLTLGAGQYTIGAFSSADHFGVYGVTPTTTSGLHIVNSALLSFASTLDKPTSDFSSVYANGFFGPNLRFTAGDETLTVNASGSFVFPTGVANGDSYQVTVDTQPAGKTCTVTNGSGTVAGSTVTNVNVSCVSNPYTVGGSVSGLTGSVTLLNNAGNALTLNANGSFSFTNTVLSGNSYLVTVQAQPVGQTCLVTNGSGAISSTNVTNVSVSCTTNTYTVGGSVLGLGSGKTVTLLNNGGNALPVTANGSFAFTTAVLSGNSYAVTISIQPAGQSCAVANGSGNVSSTNVTNISVSCTPNPYTVGGSVSGLNGSVTLLNNTGNALQVSANGLFTFTAALLSGNSYAVTVSTQPAGQTCAVTNGSGTINAANVTNVAVSCTTTTNSYTVAGNVFGLGTGLSVSLKNNGGTALPISANGSFIFPAALSAGSSYAVTVSGQPTGQTCTVTNGSGSNINGNVWGVIVSCATGSPTYTISGSITMNGGHFGTGTAGTCTGITCAKLTATYSDGTTDVLGNLTTGLPLNDTATTNISAFPTAKPPGTGYTISLQLSSTNKGLCSISNASGVITTGNMTYTIQCVAPKNVPNAVTIGGTVAGLTGTLQLADNGNDSITLNAGNTSFNMPWNAAYFVQSIDPNSGATVSGGVYSLTVSQQPTGQTCQVFNGNGVIVSSSITNINVICVNTAQQTSPIGGTLSGLNQGESVTLLDNGGDNLIRLSNGVFTFPTNVIQSYQYNVTVLAQPTTQICTVTNGNGTSPGGGASISNVQVNCAADTNTYAVSGSVSGLAASLTLLNNGGDTQTVAANGTSFAFTPQVSGANYLVTVGTQPAGQTCFVFNNSGTNLTANVSNVSVACSANTYQIGGTVSGLSGSVVLQSGLQSLTVTANGSFAFSSSLATGALYSVYVNNQPVGQTCSVTNGSGAVGTIDVTGVSVSCAAGGQASSDYNVVLGRPTDSGVTISILGNTSDWGGSAYITYSTSPGQTAAQSTQSGTVTSSGTAYPTGSTHPVIEVPLTGLAANTKYYYRVNYKTASGSTYVAGNEHSFYTQRTAGSTFSFGVQGDSHPERYGDKMFHSELYKLTMAEIAKRQPDMYFMLGDDFSMENFVTGFESANNATGNLFSGVTASGITPALYGKTYSCTTLPCSYTYGTSATPTTYNNATLIPNPFCPGLGEGCTTVGNAYAQGYGQYLGQRQNYLGLMSHSTHLFMVNGNHEQESMANLGTIFNNNAVIGASQRNKFYPEPTPAASWTGMGTGFYSGDTESFATGHPNLNGYPGVDGDGLLRDYYAFEWGDALFITIDPYWHSPNTVDNGIFTGAASIAAWSKTMGDAQYFWLKNVLETSTKKYKFIFTHHINGTGRGGASNVTTTEWGGGNTGEFATYRQCAGMAGCLVSTNWPKPVHQLLVDTKDPNGYTVFFQGHDHAFAREEVDGVIYQSLANPADNSYWAYNCSAYSPASIGAFASEFSAYGHYDKNWSQTLPGAGFVYVTVSPQQLKLQYIRTYRAIDLMLDANSTLYDSLTGHSNGEAAFTYTLKAGSTYAQSSAGDSAVSPYHCYGDAPPATGYVYNHYSVSGSLSGLGSGKFVTLLLNGGTALTLSSNGSFTFPTTLSTGTTTVSVGSQPAGQTCTVSNATGSVGSYPNGANITNVSVSCT